MIDLSVDIPDLPDMNKVAQKALGYARADTMRELMTIARAEARTELKGPSISSRIKTFGPKLWLGANPVLISSLRDFKRGRKRKGKLWTEVPGYADTYVQSAKEYSRRGGYIKDVPFIIREGKIVGVQRADVLPLMGRARDKAADNVSAIFQKHLDRQIARTVANL